MLGSELLSPEENLDLLNIVPDNSELLSTCVAQVLFTEPPYHDSWTTVGGGVLCFVRNNDLETFCLQFYDLPSKICIWEQEIYLELDYRLSLNSFHMFEADTGIAGLNFASESEAWAFSGVLLDELSNLKMNDRRERVAALSNVRVEIQPAESGTQPPGTFSTQTSLSPPSRPSSRPSSPGPPKEPSLTSKTVEKVKQARDSVSAQLNNTFRRTRVRVVSVETSKTPGNVVVLTDKPSSNGTLQDRNDPTIQDIFRRAGVDIREMSDSAREYAYNFIKARQAVVKKEKGSAGGKIIEKPPPKMIRTEKVNLSPDRSRNRLAPPPRPAPPSRSSSPRPGGTDQLSSPQPTRSAASAPRPPVAVKIRHGSSALSLSEPTSPVSPPPPPPPPPPPHFAQPLKMTSSLVDYRLIALTGQEEDLIQFSELDESPVSKIVSPRVRLLQEIRLKSETLKKHVVPTSATTESPAAQEETELDGMAAALARALANIRFAVNDQDDDDKDSQDTEDEWDV